MLVMARLNCNSSYAHMQLLLIEKVQKAPNPPKEALTSENMHTPVFFNFFS